jgi:hypothetical protein
MFEVLIFLIGFFVGTVVMNLFYTGKRVGTLLFHDPESMIAQLDCPVEDIYKYKRVMFTVSRR